MIWERERLLLKFSNLFYSLVCSVGLCPTMYVHRCNAENVALRQENECVGPKCAYLDMEKKLPISRLICQAGGNI